MMHSRRAVNLSELMVPLRDNMRDDLNPLSPELVDENLQEDLSQLSQIDGSLAILRHDDYRIILSSASYILRANILRADVSKASFLKKLMTEDLIEVMMDADFLVTEKSLAIVQNRIMMCNKGLMLAAVRQLDTEAFHALYDHGMTLNVTDQVGNGLLSILLQSRCNPSRGYVWSLPDTIEQRMLSILSVLLGSEQINLSQRNDDRIFPLFYAIESTFDKILDRLLAQSPSLNGSVKGETLLHWALKNPDPYMLHFLVKKQGVSVDVLNGRGETPLYQVASGFSALDENSEWFNIKYQQLEMLLSLGADVNISVRNNVPLMAAIFSGKRWLMQFLTDHGADWSVRLSGQNTLLHFAVIMGASNSMLETIIFYAPELRHQVNRNGETPLYQAILEGKYDIAKTLWRLGSDFSIQLPGGRHILHQLIQVYAKTCYNLSKNIKKTLYWLLRQPSVKLALNTQDDEGNTPLFYALSGGLKLKMIRRLVSAGANVHDINPQGQTYLHQIMTCSGPFLTETRRSKNISYLIKKGLAINVIDGKGNTPLHDALKLPSLEALFALLRYNPDLSIKNHQGHTPLESLLSQCAPIYYDDWTKVIWLLSEDITLLDIINSAGQSGWMQICDKGGRNEILPWLKEQNLPEPTLLPTRAASPLVFSLGQTLGVMPQQTPLDSLVAYRRNYQP